MKKKYVRPESRLYAINLSENIAGSGASDAGDLVSGNSVIKFTHAGDGCRGYYTGDMTAPVTAHGSFANYARELESIIQSTLNFATYFNCYKSMYV